MKAIYAGTFDPFTNGHLDIAIKAANIFNSVTVLVCSNSDKNTVLTSTERADCIANILLDMRALGDNRLSQIVVKELPANMFLADYARHNGGVLVRGIRNNIDFEYERGIERTNRSLNPTLETVFIPCSESLSHVSSSWVKGLMNFDGAEFELLKNVHPFALSHLYGKKLFREFLHSGDYLNSHYHSFTHLSYMAKALYYFNGIRLGDIQDKLVDHDIDNGNPFNKACQYDSMITGMQPFIKVLRAADLWVLGENQTNYDTYVDLVKKEYYAKYRKEWTGPLVSFKEWEKIRFNSARKAALNQLLALPKLFDSEGVIFHKHTEFVMRESYARENIKRELKNYE